MKEFRSNLNFYKSWEEFQFFYFDIKKKPKVGSEPNTKR